MTQGVKKIDKQKFYEAYDMFLNCGMSLEKCAKHVGISVPTLKKYFEYEIFGKEFPDTLFEKRNRRG